MGLGIGIDFGTICSKLAYFDGDKATVLATVPSEELGLPAVRRLFEYQCSESPDVRAKIDEFFRKPDLKIQGAFPGDFRVCLSGKRYTPDELCVRMLSHLKTEAEAQLGNHDKVDRCAIGVPFGSTLAYHHLLRRSAIKAGFNWTELVSELEAISLDLQRFLTGRERYVLVCDMGGTSAQVALLLVEKEREGTSSLEVRAAARSQDLGGWQLDADLMDYIVGELDLDEETRRFVHSSAFRREVARARELLSWERESLVRIEGTRSYRLSRSVVKRKVSRYENTVHALVNQVLWQANLKVGQIDQVFLVGGMARTFSIRESFCNYFGNKVSIVDSPQQCIVRGCTIWLRHWEQNVIVRTVTHESPESFKFIYIHSLLDSSDGLAQGQKKLLTILERVIFSIQGQVSRSDHYLTNRVSSVPEDNEYVYRNTIQVFVKQAMLAFVMAFSSRLQRDLLEYQKFSMNQFVLDGHQGQEFSTSQSDLHKIANSSFFSRSEQDRLMVSISRSINSENSILSTHYIFLCFCVLMIVTILTISRLIADPYITYIALIGIVLMAAISVVAPTRKRHRRGTHGLIGELTHIYAGRENSMHLSIAPMIRTAIEKLVREDRLPEALEKLFDTEVCRCEVILLARCLNNLHKQERQGVLGHSEVEVGRTRIAKSIIDLISPS